MKYRREVIVEAVQYKLDDDVSVEAIRALADANAIVNARKECVVYTASNVFTLTGGRWLVKHGPGDFSTWGDVEFRRDYMPADNLVVAKHTPMPEERPGTTHPFKLHYKHSNGVGDVMKFYFTASTYPSGQLGEVFVKADKSGSLASGALQVVSILISVALQHGVPLKAILSKLRHTKFKPDGFTGDPEFPSCDSPVDLLAQWLEKRFIPKEPNQ